ncbi:hypothetical protein ACFL20_03735 [Spirochaetota bacterium]
MFARKKKLINKKFQLRTTIIIISSTTVVFMALIIIIGINVIQNSRQISEFNIKLGSHLNQINSSIKVENNIVKAFVKYSKHVSSKSNLAYLRKIEIDHGKSMKAINNYITFSKGFVENMIVLTSNNILIVIVVFIIIIMQGIVIYFYLIRMTHRISGPIYIMSKHIEDLISGSDPDIRDLRDKDEFKDFYKLFTELTEKIKEDKSIKYSPRG